MSWHDPDGEHERGVEGGDSSLDTSFATVAGRLASFRDVLRWLGLVAAAVVAVFGYWFMWTVGIGPFGGSAPRPERVAPAVVEAGRGPSANQCSAGELRSRLRSPPREWYGYSVDHCFDEGVRRCCSYPGSTGTQIVCRQPTCTAVWRQDRIEFW